MPRSTEPFQGEFQRRAIARFEALHVPLVWELLSKDVLRLTIPKTDEQGFDVIADVRDYGAVDVRAERWETKGWEPTPDWQGDKFFDDLLDTLAALLGPSARYTISENNSALWTMTITDCCARGVFPRGSLNLDRRDRRHDSAAQVLQNQRLPRFSGPPVSRPDLALAFAETAQDRLQRHAARIHVRVRRSWSDVALLWVVFFFIFWCVASAAPVARSHPYAQVIWPGALAAALALALSWFAKASLEVRAEIRGTPDRAVRIDIDAAGIRDSRAAARTWGEIAKVIGTSKGTLIVYYDEEDAWIPAKALPPGVNKTAFEQQLRAA